ncbi:hypothetical protein BJ170DRAFT_602804 [Xylariales sp. AK1849]|nr:hypothetical protein BJ170DRAFT_602804 [Xylariales sp. AK1849]
MAPHVGFDTEQIRDKARKDLLYLLEEVSPWKEEPRDRTEPSWPHWRCCQGLNSTGLWSGQVLLARKQQC